RVLQALAVRRWDVVAAPPDVDLFVPVLGCRLGLAEALQVAVVALVQRLVLDDRKIGNAELAERDAERLLRAHQLRGEGAGEGALRVAESYSGGVRLGAPLLGQRDVDPAGEAVLEVPLRLSVAEQDEDGHVGFLSMTRARETSRLSELVVASRR